MIQDGNRLSLEDEAELALSLLQIHDFLERLKSLHKFFKFSSTHIIEIFRSDPDAYENLDTLLYMFFGDNEMILDELLHNIEKARKLMQPKKHS
ncbi:hypothetical protein IQ264_27495 [Phormidium sp. LEGE 05292]|uniref:hypothetical protein n=1 Tax=[Phormidium] sp. LEGE 05292 TaxID=767427 RepID=UPI00187DEF7F|nr:hypothetical protein [Phormidium sp. LEGE 05292]MBE9229152.1 hypothetical protein [Phormidium sp. LEGE 05292]